MDFTRYFCVCTLAQQSAPFPELGSVHARFAQVTLEKMSTSSDSDSDATTRTRSTSLSPDTCTKDHFSHLHRPIDKKAKAGKVAMARIVAATTAASAPFNALSMISAAAVIGAKPTASAPPSGVEPMLLSAQPTALVDDNFMSSEIELHLIREELAGAHRDLERARRRMYHEAEARRAVEQAKHAFAALAPPPPPPPPPSEAAPPAVSHAVPCGRAPNATARGSFALFDPTHAAAHAASVAAASVAAAAAAAAAAQFEAEQRQKLAAAHAASIAAASIAAASASVAAAQFEAEHSRKKKVDAANILSTLFTCG